MELKAKFKEQSLAAVLIQVVSIWRKNFAISSMQVGFAKSSYQYVLPLRFSSRYISKIL